MGPSAAADRGSELAQDAVERTRDAAQGEGPHHERGVDDLPPGPGAQETAELRADWLSSPLGLLLKGAERGEVALGVEEAFHGRWPEGSDQLVFEIFVADVEAEPLHVVPTEGAEAGLLER